MAKSSIDVSGEWVQRLFQDPDRLRGPEIARTVGDASKLRALTGWTPQQSVDDLLVRLLDHWRERIATDGR